jgi:transcriptional regulator with XRE-family HTH domain
MNQQALADGLGLSFQQVQKYEHGANRVSASCLVAIAEILGVSVAYFFLDLEANEGTPSAEEKQSRERMRQPETIDLVRFYYGIPDERVRGEFLNLVKAIAASQ